MTCQIKKQVRHTVLARELDEDRFAISDFETDILHDFAMEGFAAIADEAHMVKHDDQTGIDAVSYNEQLELETDADEDEIIDKDDDESGETDVAVKEVTGESHRVGEKLSYDKTDLIVFSIDGLEDDIKRYTVVQQFIRMALINFVIMRWWLLKAQPDLASNSQALYDSSLEKVRFNSIRNLQRKDGSIPYSNALI